MVDSETDGAAVVESIEDSAVGKVGGEATLLEHLAREGGENVMEGFVEEHDIKKELYTSRHNNEQQDELLY
jgi:hypothetical protein